MDSTAGLPQVAVDSLSYRFRGSERDALSQVSLRIAPGEFVAVTGPSGCGKSTLALAIGGYLFQQYDGEAGGSLHVAGLDVRQAPVYDTAEVVGLVQQNPEAQFCTLTVRDEVAFGLENRRLPRAEIARRLAWALEVTGATHLVERELATLSGGEKQKVAIAAILAAEPQVLILDEPTSNLDPSATAEIFSVIARLQAERGLTVIVIEHKLGYLLPFRPRLVVMEAGTVVFDGPPEGYPAPPLPAPRPQAPPPQATPVVRADGLHLRQGESLILKGIDLAVRPGELVALMGDNGSGKTTLLLSLLGLLKPERGRVEVLGQDTRRTPVSRLAQDVGFVFQNPDHQLFADTVWQEAVLAPQNLGLLDDGVEGRLRELLARSGLAGRQGDHPYRLSFGEKRRLNLVSILGARPRLILLDEVLIGQDARNVTFLMNLLLEQTARGAAVVMAVHDPEIAQRYATRLLFMAGGRLLVDAVPAEGFRELAALGRPAYLPASLHGQARAASEERVR